MAGFFGLFDYTKEGPGIPKDAPPKSRFAIFFEVLGRKFFNIIKVNLMFFFFNLPATIFLVLFSMYYQEIFLSQEVLQSGGGDVLSYLVSGTIPLLLILICFPLITVGPAQAGMTYILRNYSREEHAFLWSDFIEHAKKNFKQSMIVGLINTVITIIVLLDFYIYLKLQSGSLLITIGGTLIVVAFVIFMMMSMYLYPMMVTFKLTLKELYKNALLFAIMKLFPNLLILIVCLVIVILPFYFFPALGYLLLIVITLALISYITNFYVYPKIDKYMIKPLEAEQANDEKPEQLQQS